MKVTNGEIFNSRESLQILLGARLPVLVSLQVADLVMKLNDPFVAIETVRTVLVNIYGQKQESGEMVVVFPGDPLDRPTSPDWEKFVAETKKLMAQTVNLDVKKVKLPIEIDGKPLQIEPSILIALDKFIDVE